SSCPFFERRKIAKRSNSRQEKIGAATHRCKCRKSLDFFSHWSLRNCHIVGNVVRTYEWVPLIAQFMKIGIVYPHIHRKLKLANQTSAADEGGDASFNAVFRSVFR